MSAWTHLACESCWTAQGGARVPVRVDGPPSACCFCGGETRSGIYVREAPTSAAPPVLGARGHPPGPTVSARPLASGQRVMALRELDYRAGGRVPRGGLGTVRQVGTETVMVEWDDLAQDAQYPVRAAVGDVEALWRPEWGKP